MYLALATSTERAAGAASTVIDAFRAASGSTAAWINSHRVVLDELVNSYQYVSNMHESTCWACCARTASRFQQFVHKQQHRSSEQTRPAPVHLDWPFPRVHLGRSEMRELRHFS